ncbi:PPC domain-containing protein [Opitutus sp. ER46]|uniref:PPC domain-containing protein n=1 Tax=Opitutus sp. ER46 TaxID=2161864 RepID=UPI000D305529|nr:PPC domain-containing protein [Opitutus sp. ER46]PTX97685.1 hypothetical protein DB354_05230 [Opitutus sp. ER46]
MALPLSLRPFLSRLQPAIVATAIAAACFVTVPARAQNQNAGRTPPHLGYAYPAGAEKGQTVTITVGGQNLNGVDQALTTDPAITAKVTGYDRPLTQKELNDLRDKVQALLEKRAAARGTAAPERVKGEGRKGAEKKAAKEPEPAAPSGPRPTWTEADELQLAELRRQMAKPNARQGNPAIAESVTVELTVPAEAAPGTFDLRLKSPAGVSNPMVLNIGELPEYSEAVVTAASMPKPRGKREAASPRPNRPQTAPVEITLPATVNGQILPGEVDRYRFTARAGQHITVAVAARSLIPYLADAVPGWFQATVALYDPEGREVAYSDSFRFSPDPVVSFLIPADGTYAVEIKDSIYRGREDFVYRFSIGELPFVTSVFPLGGRVNEATTFELTGWNLPASRLTMDTKDRMPGTFMLAVRNRGQLSNNVRFALDASPTVREAADHTAGAAQALQLPTVVDGRIGRPGEEDVYTFTGKAGDEVIAEVFARRLGSPLDSILRVTNSTGQVLASNDDTEDKGVGLMTHHADSRVSLKLSADGTYLVRLADAQGHGAPEYGYRLRVGAPRPDFELRIAPSAINTRRGMHTPVTVYALRHDGFNGEIRLALQDPPPGIFLSGARIPAGQDKVQFTIAAGPNASDEPIKLLLFGVATIAGESVAREAIPAEDMMQAFAYHHLVPVRELLLSASGRPGAICRLLSRTPVTLTPSGTTRLTLSASAARGVEKISVELSDPPAGIAVKSAKVSGNIVEVELTCDAAKVKPGQQGNLILNAFGERTNAKDKAKRAQRTPLGSVPAIPFEISAQ